MAKAAKTKKTSASSTMPKKKTSAKKKTKTKSEPTMLTFQDVADNPAVLFDVEYGLMIDALSWAMQHDDARKSIASDFMKSGKAKAEKDMASYAQLSAKECESLASAASKLVQGTSSSTAHAKKCEDFATNLVSNGVTHDVVVRALGKVVGKKVAKVDAERAGSYVAGIHQMQQLTNMLAEVITGSSVLFDGEG
jgi:hypothetical protein